MSEGEVLRSLQNPRVKQLVRLRERRERKKTGLTRIDGGRELLRALQAGVRPEVVYVCSEHVSGPDAEAALVAADEAGVARQEVSPEVLERIRYGDRDEGLCAVLRWQPAGLEELAARQDLGFLLVVEGVEKPGNLGALLRTADGAGVDAVLFVDPACELANPNAIRASMGTIFTQPVHQASGEEARAWLAETSLRLLVTRPEAPRSCFDVDLRTPVAVVMGSESAGLSAPWNALEAEVVHLPMRGVSDSLNLAAATAVLLYEVVRQRST